MIAQAWRLGRVPRWRRKAQPEKVNEDKTVSFHDRQGLSDQSPNGQRCLGARRKGENPNGSCPERPTVDKMPRQSPSFQVPNNCKPRLTSAIVSR